MKNILSLGFLFFFLFLACAENELEETTSPPSFPETFSPEQKVYAEKGLAIQKETATALFSQLEQALENGPEQALKTCNLAASPIVRNLSKKYKASIRRTTLKPRNAINSPTEFEKKILTGYQEKHEAGEAIETRVEFFDEQVAYYAPIYMKEQCLQCHGEIGGSLDKDFYPNIEKLYPRDKAHGFKTGDLRGIWSITVPRELTKK